MLATVTAHLITQGEVDYIQEWDPRDPATMVRDSIGITSAPLNPAQHGHGGLEALCMSMRTGMSKWMSIIGRYQTLKWGVGGYLLMQLHQATLACIHYAYL